MKDLNYIIVSDIHGKYDIFIKLISSLVKIKDGIIQENKYKIILLGDFIDKGKESEQIKLVNFIYNNLKNLIVILGNHEQKARRKLSGELVNMSSKYNFHCIADEDKLTFVKFIAINDQQITHYEDDFLICTHSPCKKEDLDNKTSNMVQCKVRRKSTSESESEYNERINEFFQGIFEENDYHKMHFFGHMGGDEVIVNNKQVWLETSCDDNITVAHIEKGNIEYLSNNAKSRVRFLNHPKEGAEMLNSNFRKKSF